MKLCVALDMASKDENLALVRQLAGLDVWLKVGLRSYLRDGASFINELKNLGEFKIFLDLKIYDIPNTMADACEVIAKLNVDMINLHASAGARAISEVMKRLNALPKRPLVLGVSALTSFSDDEFYQIYNDNIANGVKKMSEICFKSGLDGMVCSVFESKMIKQASSENFITLTPGIRPFGEADADQKRVANLEVAKEAKSDFIVVGRPIYQAQDPREIVSKILSKL
ncbi:MAG: orotidine-5'-phosphate decarboxylase [Campylobacter sp.]|nr:orotidine-5'-phosphate decarboxylase [Campylobacter sp.]